MDPSWSYTSWSTLAEMVLVVSAATSIEIECGVLRIDTADILVIRV